MQEGVFDGRVDSSDCCSEHASMDGSVGTATAFCTFIHSCSPEDTSNLLEFPVTQQQVHVFSLVPNFGIHCHEIYYSWSPEDDL